jgi:hypothetical protein
MKTIPKRIVKHLRAIGMLLARVVSELVKDAVAWTKRRHALPWPDGSTATTLW